MIDRDGHILTNYHVIEDAQEVGVTLFDGKTYDAKLVGADHNNDIAVIKIDAPREVLFPDSRWAIRPICASACGSSPSAIRSDSNGR